MSWTDIITPSSDTESRSGLYAIDLPGITLNIFDDLTKEDQADWEECWSSIYNRSTKNFTKDIQSKISSRFHIDLKLVSRETSEFLTSENTNSGSAGIKLNYTMPKYAQIRVIQVIVNSLEAYEDFDLNFYEDDASGELLYTKTVDLVAGKNTINIDRDFEVVDTLFVGYDADSYRLYQTKNRYFADGAYIDWDDIACTFPCWGGAFNASITQFNGGGPNVKAVVHCSIEKFIQENINLFDVALWYRIGVEIMKERITSDRFNRFTTLTKDRAVELMEVYNGEYQEHLTNSTMDLNIQEDDICFECKSTVYSTQLLP